LTNITNADFLVYFSAADFPRKLRFPTQFVVPGAAGSMPVIMDSLGNEALVAWSFGYDTNPFAQPPMLVCGANSAGCTVMQNNSVFGRVGVTITPAGGGFARPDGTPLDETEAAGPNEIAKINFLTVPTPNIPSTDFTSPFSGNPTTFSIVETGTGNPLTAVFVTPLRVVFALGNEGDVATRNAGNGINDSGDVVQTRRFVTGLDTPVTTHNEFQRADTSPSTMKGNGQLDSTDVIQARRYSSGLDQLQSAGGPGQAIVVVAPNPVVERAAQGQGQSQGQSQGQNQKARDLTVGSFTASTEARVTVPVGITTAGDEYAASFTIRYDETRLTHPTVELAAGLDPNVALTVNTSEPGVIRILIDAASPLAGRGAKADDLLQLVNITFDVTAEAASGTTPLVIDDTVISDASANSLGVKPTNGHISIAGPNAIENMTTLPRRRQKTEEFDIIGEFTRSSPLTVVRPKGVE